MFYILFIAIDFINHPFNERFFIKREPPGIPGGPNKEERKIKRLV